MTAYPEQPLNGHLTIERIIGVAHADEVVLLVTGEPHGDRVLTTCTCNHFEHYENTLDEAEAIGRAHLTLIHVMKETP